MINQLQPPAGPRSRRILVVDADTPACKCVRSLLENLDDQVFEAHIAPEGFITEKVDQQADLFSLGSVADELFIGQLPFAGEPQVDFR